MDIEFLKQDLLWHAVFAGIGLIGIGIVMLVMWIKSKKY